MWSRRKTFSAAYCKVTEKGKKWLRDKELEKAFTPGGTYHKRVPKANGKGYTYYYDEEQYKRSKNRHVSGDEAASDYISDEVHKAVEGAGKDGCDIGTFEPLVKKYGAKKVGEVMSAHNGKKIKFKGGKFYQNEETK